MRIGAFLNRRKPRAIVSLALLGAWSCRLTEPASRAPLLTALRAGVADSLRPEAVVRGQQFSIEADTDGAWARALATVPTSSAARRPTLVLHVGRAELHGDSAIVHARLVGCTPQVPGM